jgi:FKBP12-rapamycin complex-associated protein
MPDKGKEKEKDRGGPNISDTLSRHLDVLCKPGALERRKDGDRYLLEYVEAEGRDLSTEAFAKFMNDIYTRIGFMLARG